MSSFGVFSVKESTTNFSTNKCFTAHKNYCYKTHVNWNEKFRLTIYLQVRREITITATFTDRMQDRSGQRCRMTLQVLLVLQYDWCIWITWRVSWSPARFLHAAAAITKFVLFFCANKGTFLWCYGKIFNVDSNLVWVKVLYPNKKPYSPPWASCLAFCITLQTSMMDWSGWTALDWTMSWGT